MFKVTYGPVKEKMNTFMICLLQGLPSNPPTVEEQPSPVKKSRFKEAMEKKLKDKKTALQSSSDIIDSKSLHFSNPYLLFQCTRTVPLNRRLCL